MDLRDLHLSLVQRLLAAPGSLEGWRAFLDELCTALDGVGSNIIALEFGEEPHAVVVHARTDPAAVREYHVTWGQHDPWAAAMRDQNRAPGVVAIGDDLVPQASMHRLGFFNDFGLRYDVTQTLLGLTELTPQKISCVSVNRGERQPRFNERDQRFVDALMPHIQRALALHRRLEGCDTMAATLSEVTERLGRGVVLLGANGRVVFANRVAAAMLRERDGLAVDAGALRASTRALTDQLQRAIAAALATAQGAVAEVPPALSLARPSGKRPYTILVSALPANRMSIEPHPAQVILFVTDPESRPVPDQSILRRVFGLTTAEAALVAHLCAGFSLSAAAVRLRISGETARSRLKIIFQKTHTHRQVDLLRLVMNAV